MDLVVILINIKHLSIEDTKAVEVIVVEMILASLAIVTSLSVFYLPAGDNGSV